LKQIGKEGRQEGRQEEKVDKGPVANRKFLVLPQPKRCGSPPLSLPCPISFVRRDQQDLRIDGQDYPAGTDARSVHEGEDAGRARQIACWIMEIRGQTRAQVRY